jgi:hypothetical protein
MTVKDVVSHGLTVSHDSTAFYETLHMEDELLDEYSVDSQSESSPIL